MLEIIAYSILFVVFGPILLWAISRWIKINILKIKFGDHLEDGDIVIYDNGHEVNRIHLDKVIELKTILRQRNSHSDNNISTEFILKDVDGLEVGVYNSLRSVNKFIKSKKLNVKRTLVEQVN